MANTGINHIIFNSSWTETDTFVYPISDVSADTWTFSTGTSLWSCLDDTDNTDYIQCLEDGSDHTCVVLLGTPTGMPLDETASIYYEYSLRSRFGGDIDILQIDLYMGATLIKSSGHIFINTTTFTTQTITLSAAERASITSVSDLRFKLTQISDPGSGGVRVGFARLFLPGVVSL